MKHQENRAKAAFERGGLTIGERLASIGAQGKGSVGNGAKSEAPGLERKQKVFLNGGGFFCVRELENV